MGTWSEQIDPDGNVSLRDLSQYLNKSQFDSLRGIEKTRDLLFETEFKDMVIEGKDGTIIDLRNDFAHNNVSHISEEEFDRAEDYIESILTNISQEMPILGVVGEQNEYQAHLIRLLRVGPNDEIDVQTNKQLQKAHLYFLPRNAATGERVQTLNPEEIQPCKSEDIVESIESHSDADFTKW